MTHFGEWSVCVTVRGTESQSERKEAQSLEHWRLVSAEEQSLQGTPLKCTLGISVDVYLFVRHVLITRKPD